MNEIVNQGIPLGLFVFFCALSVVSALGVVVLRNPVSSAFALILTFLNVAGIFAMQEAFFIAAVQVIVYAGAIMVLFVFVIMLLSIEKVDLDFPSNKVFLPVPIVLGAAFMFAMFFVLTRGSYGTATGPYTIPAIEASGGNVRVVSELMFSDYVLPFLTMGMLLSAAIVGAVLLAKRRVD